MRVSEIMHQTGRDWAASRCEPFPCGLAVWEYVCKVSGVEQPELPYHQDRATMIELLRSKGGLEAYARELMLGLGWQEVPDPIAGDVAVADMPGMGLTCVICAGRLMMAKGDGFVLLRPAPVKAVWRYPECLRLSQSQSSQRSVSQE